MLYERARDSQYWAIFILTNHQSLHETNNYC